MSTLYSYKTKFVRKEDHEPKWYVVDARDKVVGRLASEVAKILRGKHRPGFTPHINCGDKVIIINAEHVRFTGNKMVEKQYRKHTGYPGGRRLFTPQDLKAKGHDERILYRAIRGMLPKNRLGRQLLKNVRIYKGEAHPHAAQKPEKLDI